MRRLFAIACLAVAVIATVAAGYTEPPPRPMLRPSVDDAPKAAPPRKAMPDRIAAPKIDPPRVESRTPGREVIPVQIQAPIIEPPPLPDPTMMSSTPSPLTSPAATPVPPVNVGS